MTKISIDDVMSYKVVADKMVKRCRKFRYHVYGVTMDAIDVNYSHIDDHKWWARANDVINDYFTFADGVDEGLIVGVILEHHEILVIADFNGKRYFAQPIKPKNGKNQIKDILDNMGVVKDVIDVYTNNMVNNNMEENNMVDMVNSVDMTGFDENGFAIDGLAYVNENMKTVDVDMIKECIYEMVGDEYVVGEMFGWDKSIKVDFEDFCDRLWTDYVWEKVLDSGCTDETLEGETRYVMEFNDRVRYIVEHDFDMLYINCYDEIGVDDMVKNESPCLDDVDRVVKVIEDYVNNYEGMLMDYDGNSASICVPWDVFNEDDMKMLIEDADFEYSVVGVLMGRDIKDVLVYDDGVYVSVDADMFDKVA